MANNARLNKVPSKFSPSLGKNDGKFISTWNFGYNNANSHKTLRVPKTLKEISLIR